MSYLSPSGMRTVDLRRRPPPLLVATRAADSLAWMRTDVAIRLAPFTVLVAMVAGVWRPS